MDEAIRRIFDYFNTQQGGTGNVTAINLRANGSRTIPGYATYFDGSLASPSVREITAGYGAAIGKSGFARVDYVHRDWRDFYAASVTTATQQSEHAARHPGRSDARPQQRQSAAAVSRRADAGALVAGPFRVRHALHVVEAARQRRRRKRHGRRGGEYRSARFSIPSTSTTAASSPIGYLAGDQRHRLRAWAGYRLPLGTGALEATLMQSYDSGLPYSIAGAINLTRYTGAPANLGYATVPNGLYYFSGRGELRTESIRSTDLALRYSVRIAALEFFAQGDLLNAFNNAALFDPKALGTTVSTAATSTTFLPFDPAKQTPIECPRGAAAATCTAMGANYQLATNFGQALNNLAYQTPRTVRMSFGVRF